MFTYGGQPRLGRLAISLLAAPLLVLSACQVATPTPRTNTPDLSATPVAAAPPAGQGVVPANTTGPSSLATAASTVPNVAIDEAFAKTPEGWANTPEGPARYSDGGYQLTAKELGHFVAVSAPLSTSMREVVLSGRFHKTGGPAGGGYGLIVHDQGPQVHDGLNQGGRFVVLEVGDDGRVGVWQRDQDRWIDLVPWTANPAVHTGDAVNDLTVRAQGKDLTFFVNGTQVAWITTELAEGRVGVFAAGDGNQVVLERFAVRSPVSGTAGPAWPPQPTPMPTSAELLARLDTAWAHSDWPQTFILLDQLERVAPATLDFMDKRYAAHMAAGEDILAKGNNNAALVEFIRADALDQSRGEAKAAMVALTPVPPTPTVVVVPTVEPVSPSTRPAVQPPVVAPARQSFSVAMTGTAGAKFTLYCMRLRADGSSSSQTWKGAAPATYSLGEAAVVSCSAEKLTRAGTLGLRIIGNGGAILESAETSVQYGIVQAGTHQ